MRDCANATDLDFREEALQIDEAERLRFEPGKSSAYDQWAWPKSTGQGLYNRSCFPEIAVWAHFASMGYAAWISEPRFPYGLGFLLFHHRGKRRKDDPAFRRMARQFPDEDLHALAEDARDLKIAAGLKGSGGDPDLFVFRPGSAERFFVEAKFEDQLRPAQKICFCLIKERLGVDVRVIRLVASAQPDQSAAASGQRRRRIR